MIRENFVENPLNGWGDSTYINVPSNLTTGVPEPNFNLFENYLMGYVPADKSGWTPMKIDTTGDTDNGQGLKLTPHKGKIGWTFTGNCQYNKITVGTIKRDNTNYWISANYNPYWTVIQEFTPAKYTCYGGLYVGVIAYKPTPIEGKDGWETIQNADHYGTTSFNINPVAVDDFFAGNYSTSITVNNNTYNFTINDWNSEYNRFEIKENDEIVLCLSIYGLSNATSKHWYDGSLLQDNFNPGLLSIGLTQNIGDNVIYSPHITNLWMDTQMSSGNTCLELSNSGKTVKPLNCYYSGDPAGAGNYGYLNGDFYYDGHTYWSSNIRETDLEIPTEFFQWLWSYNNSSSSPSCVYKGIVITYIGGNRIYAVRAAMPLNFVKTAWYLINKVNTQEAAINGYSYNTPTSIFNPDNSPSYKKRTGTDEVLDPVLRPWQKLDGKNSDDEFKEDDIPDPEGGGGDDDWDPDTATGDDTNDYEEDPTTTLNKPPFGGYGPRFWVMSNSEFQAVYDSIMQIYKAYANYFRINSLSPAAALAFSWVSAQQAIQDKYSGFAGGNPLDAVAAVFWYPFDVSLVLQTTTATFRWGLTEDTEWVSGDGMDGAPPVVAAQQKLEATDFADNAYWLDGGFTDYFKHYENFMDYSPYCRAELYLPYCGSIQIDPNMFVGHHISVRYLIDFNSGTCLALVYRDNLVVDSIAGQIGIQLPISGPNYGTYINQAVSATSGVNNARIGLIGSAVSALTATGQIGGATATEAAISGIGGGLKALGHNAPTLVGAGLDVARSVNDLTQASYNLQATKPAMQVCSTATPIISAANEQVCRLVLYQPRWLDGYDTNDYGNYGHTTGFATIENKRLELFKGFTVAETIDTSGISQATEKEKAMIARAFKTGVYMPN